MTAVAAHRRPTTRRFRTLHCARAPSAQPAPHPIPPAPHLPPTTAPPPAARARARGEEPRERTPEPTEHTGSCAFEGLEVIETLTVPLPVRVPRMLDAAHGLTHACGSCLPFLPSERPWACEYGTRTGGSRRGLAVLHQVQLTETSDEHETPFR